MKITNDSGQDYFTDEKIEKDLLKDTSNDKVNVDLNYIFTKPASSQLKYEITSDLLHKHLKIN